MLPTTVRKHGRRSTYSTTTQGREKTLCCGIVLFMIIYFLSGFFTRSTTTTHSSLPKKHAASLDLDLDLDLDLNKITKNDSLRLTDFQTKMANISPKDITKEMIQNNEKRPSRVPTTIDIAVVADLDKNSKSNDTVHFTSLFTRGRIEYKTMSSYSISWSEPEVFSTKMNEGGRGFELSELTWFRGKLYTFDDRTGIVYQLHNFRGGPLNTMHADPAHIIMEGDGHSGKGQKNEWATVKDDFMYVGSIGKEYTDNEGNIINSNNFWVARIGPTGHLDHLDWSYNYELMRKSLHCEYPGYLIHEAIRWSRELRKWIILPRRVSYEPYNDTLDERKGSNVILIASEDFKEIDVRRIGTITPERGFSSFTFVPSTHDFILIALKSMENEAAQTQSSFITIFDLDGHVYLEESLLPGQGVKYEGVELLTDWTPRRYALEQSDASIEQKH